MVEVSAMHMQQDMWLDVMVVEVSAMLRAAKHVVGGYGG